MRRIISLLIFLAPLASAQPPDAVHAYHTGDYREAVVLAKTVQDADGFAFAARAVLAEAISMTGADPSEAALDEAEALALAALEQDPMHIEARLQLAITLSLKARPMGLWEALRSGYGQTAKILADNVLLEAPDNLYAHGFLAAWHIEVLRRGGRFGAARLGASLKQARKHYIAAKRIAPDDAAMHWQWARALAAKSVSKHRDEIEAALAAALDAYPDDALEHVMQDRARRLDEALSTLPAKEVQALAASLL